MAKDVSLIRIKADTNDYERSIKQAQKTWNDFTKGLGLNVGKLSAVGVAIGAVSTALKVAKDAFFKNEQQLDEWGRTVKSAESLYSGFLNTLNGGSISGYLQNINNIMRAAREAYDAMDALGTFNAFNQINVSKAQANFTNAIAEFREGTGSKESVQAAADALKKELEARRKLQQEAYDKAVALVARDHQVSPTFLQIALGGSYENYEFYKNQGLTGKKQDIVGAGANARLSEVAVPANMAEEIGVELRKLNDTELQDLQALGAAAYQTSNEIAQIDKQLARVLHGGTGGSGGSGGKGGATDEEAYVPAIGSIDEMRAKVKELQNEFNKTADQSIRGQLLVAIDKAQKKLDYMSGKGLSLVGRQNTSLTEHLGLGFDAEKLKKDINPVDFDNSKKVEAIVEQWTKQLDRESNNEQIDKITTIIGKLQGSLGNVVSGLKSMGIELPEEVNALLGAIQGVGQIISSVGAIIELVSATSETANTSAILANTSAVIALTTAMTTNSFLSLMPFARGGIVRAANGYEVPGNYYSGDMVPAFLNSGELVLNKSQQGVLAATLQDSAAGRSQNLLAKVKGTDLIVMLDRTGRMTGKGELAFWKD